jgi:hypothetical protein
LPSRPISKDAGLDPFARLRALGIAPGPDGSGGLIYEYQTLSALRGLPRLGLVEPACD